MERALTLHTINGQAEWKLPISVTLSPLETGLSVTCFKVV